MASKSNANEKQVIKDDVCQIKQLNISQLITLVFGNFVERLNVLKRILDGESGVSSFNFGDVLAQKIIEKAIYGRQQQTKTIYEMIIQMHMEMNKRTAVLEQIVENCHESDDVDCLSSLKLEPKTSCSSLEKNATVKNGNRQKNNLKFSMLNVYKNVPEPLRNGSNRMTKDGNNNETMRKGNTSCDIIYISDSETDADANIAVKNEKLDVGSNCNIIFMGNKSSTQRPQTTNREQWRSLKQDKNITQTKNFKNFCKVEQLTTHHSKLHKVKNESSTNKPYELLKGNNHLICYICNRKFNSFDWLRLHLQRHPVATRKCDICDKVFTTVKGLRHHKDVHLREQLFSCKVCRTRFTRLENFTQHLKKVHFKGKLK